MFMKQNKPVKKHQKKENEQIDSAPVTVTSENKNPLIEYHTREHLEQLVRKKGFIINDVEGDGKSFYRAVEKQLELLNLPRMTCKELRQNLVLYLENGTKTRNYAAFVAQPVEHNKSDALLQDTERRSDTDDYIDNIENSSDQTEIRWIHYIDKISTGAWADNIAVPAMADMLKLNINKISTLNLLDTSVIEPELPDNNLVGQTHYV